MQISPTMIRTPVVMSWKTVGISTKCRMIPEDPEPDRQAPANSLIVHGVFGFLTSPISTTLETVCAGILGWQCELDSNFNPQLRRDFYSLYDWCYQMIWVFSGAPENTENNTMMENNGAETVYCAARGLMQAIWTEDAEAQHDAAHQMIQNGKRLTILRWSESKLPNVKPLIRILMENAHYIDRDWTEDEQAKLKTLGERFMSRGASGARMVHRWWLARFSLVLGDTDDSNDISGQWYIEKATWYPGGFANLPIAQRTVSANACQRTCGVSRTWPWQRIKTGAQSGTRQKWRCTPRCTSSSQGGAFLSSSWPCSLFEVVANQEFCGPCGYVPHVCRNGQWWTNRNAAYIPGFTKSLCICNNTQSRWDGPKSYCSDPCCYNSDDLGIEWATAGICTSCQAWAK